MSAMQKFAWFNLAVIVFALLVVFSLMPFLGSRAMGGFGFLGFLGFAPLFFRKKPGKVLFDERDQQIQLLSFILAYSVCWVVFVLAAVYLSTAVYGENGAVPVVVVQWSVMCGFMLMQAVGSIAILVQYAGGSKDGE
ncbi:MAG TPA: hypothetical protein VH592_26075 [Gemmataceae bacterium]|jgi:hypothetical protein